MLKRILKDVGVTMGIYPAGRDQLYGVLAEFQNPGALYHAAKEVRRAGYTHFDVHSPFPIHGMDRAMGLGNSAVGYAALGGGLTGFLIGLLLQWWVGRVDYPINVGGKPFFAVEPSIPIMFELTILFSAFGAVAGMLALNGLPRPYNPLFYSRRFARATDDAFFLHIAASDRKFSLDGATGLLRDLGALHVETIEDKETTDAA